MKKEKNSQQEYLYDMPLHFYVFLKYILILTYVATLNTRKRETSSFEMAVLRRFRFLFCFIFLCFVFILIFYFIPSPPPPPPSSYFARRNLRAFFASLPGILFLLFHFGKPQCRILAAFHARYQLLVCCSGPAIPEQQESRRGRGRVLWTQKAITPWWEPRAIKGSLF